MSQSDAEMFIAVEGRMGGGVEKKERIERKEGGGRSGRTGKPR